MTTTRAILPCPFCGADGDLFDYKGIGGVKRYSVRCSNDDCGVFPSSMGSATRHEAIAKWHVRASSETPSQPVAPAVRKPVGIAPPAHYGESAVVCDDGAVFVRSGLQWHEQWPIPGTLRDATYKQYDSWGNARPAEDEDAA